MTKAMESQSLIENRIIRVFISSTFDDMGNERSELIKKTFPMLREKAAQRDVTLTEVDLRWGITEAESKSGKVVEICLREVENSIPFFIGIIGNRYGWIPRRKDVDMSLTERYRKVSDYLKQHLSATEIEIQFGVLDRAEDMHAFFFIKDPDLVDPKAPQMLSALKRKVRENNRYPVSTYISPEDLARQVEEAFTKLLDDLFPEKELSELEKERLGQRAFMNSLCRVYIKNEKNFTVIDDWMADWEKHHLVITGAGGLGKSALVANWAKSKFSLTDRIPYNIIFEFISNGGNRGNVRHVVNSLCNQIRNLYCFDAGEETPKKDSRALATLFDRVSEEGDRPLLIILDGIDQLMDYDNAKRLNWLPAVPRRVKIIYTTREQDETMRVIRDRHYPTLRLSPLSQEERQKMVMDYLRKMYSKRLSDHQIEHVVCDFKSENTLVLKTLLDELAIFGDHKKLDERIEEYLRPESDDAFFQVLLNSYESDFGVSLVRRFLSLIAVSRRGLTEDEIIRMTTPDKPLRWSQFFCSFRQHMVIRNGLVSFAHATIRNAVEERYLREQGEWERSCRNSICVLLTKENSNRSIDEVPYQLDILDDSAKLYAYLLNLRVFLYLYKYDDDQLVRYWHKLTYSGYSLKDYLPLIEKVRECDRAWILEHLGSTSVKIALNPDLSLSILEQALSYANEEKERLDILNVLSNAEMDAAKPEDALRYALEALNLRKKICVESDSMMALSYNNVGIVYHSLKNHRKAYEFCSKALNIWLGLYGEQHTRVATAFDNLGSIFGDLEDHQKALDYALKALNIRLSIFGDIHPDVARSYNNVGTQKWAMGFEQAAMESMQKSLKILRLLYGENHPYVANTYANIGFMYGKKGEYPRAVEFELSALKIRQRALGPNHPILATSYIRLGRAYAAMGDEKKAREYMVKAARVKVRLQ